MGALRSRPVLVLVALGLAAAAPASERLARLRAAAAQDRATADRAGARLAALSTQEAELQARLGRNRGELIRLLGALERWRTEPPPALVVAPRRAVDAARGALLMRAITPELERRARALAVQARALQAVRRRAAAADSTLFAAESAAADRQEAADALAGKDPLDAMLAPSATPAAPAPPAAPPARLVPPVAGPPVLAWRDPWPGRGETQGLVWRPAPDAPVRAPAAGRVEYAGALKGTRLVLILRLAGDWRVVLTGLQTVTVGEGALVAAGAIVGRAPPKGATDAEVYLQLRDGARPTDPTARLRG